MFRKRIIWKPGVMAGLMTVPQRIIQPMIAPLYDGRSAHEIVAIFTDQPSSSGYDLVQAYWRSQHSGDDFEAWWRRTSA